MNEKNLQLIQEGNFEKLLTSNKRYIHTVIHHLWKEQDPIQQQDLYQIGYIAYWRAYENFEVELCPNFNSFAAGYIRNDIKTYIEQFGNTIKITRTTRQNEGDNVKRTISTQTIINEDQILEDTLSTDYYENNYDNSSEVILDVLRHHISKLNQRHQFLLNARYIEEKTLSEISIELGITVEAIRQQIENALKKLRNFMGIEIKSSQKYKRVKSEGPNPNKGPKKHK